MHCSRVLLEAAQELTRAHQPDPDLSIFTGRDEEFLEGTEHARVGEGGGYHTTPPHAREKKGKKTSFRDTTTEVTGDLCAGNSHSTSPVSP